MNDMHTLLKRAAELEAQSVPYAIVTVIRALAPTSAKTGDKAIVCADGTMYGWIGGGCAQPAVIRTVRQALGDGMPRTIRVTPEKSGDEVLADVAEFTMTCHSGGTMELFIEPVLPKPDLVVFGASPVAQALVGLAPRVGFRVTWVEDGAALADCGEDVRRIAERDLAHIAAGSFAVVATQGKADLPALKHALAIRARHVAFVASRRKGELLKQSLVGAGADAIAVAGIEAPAGYDIDAQTPEEIALSVLASLVARRRARARAATRAPATATAGADASSKPSCCDE